MAGEKGKTISLSTDQLLESQGRIAEIDAKIAQATGNDQQARKAAIEAMTAENAETVNGFMDSLMGQLNKLEGPVLVAFTNRLNEALTEDLKEMTEKVINDRVASTATVKPEDVDKLKEQRKAELETFRATRLLLLSVGFITAEDPQFQEPKRAGGGRPAGSGGAKSGKNKENYQFYMDGKERPPSQNSFSSLAFYATEGLAADEDGSNVRTEKDSKLGAKQLKKFLADNGVQFGEQDEWEVTLPNGKKIGAKRVAPTADAEPTEPEVATEPTPEPATV
jgi:hypothetical protein